MSNVRPVPKEYERLVLAAFDSVLSLYDDKWIVLEGLCERCRRPFADVRRPGGPHLCHDCLTNGANTEP